LADKAVSAILSLLVTFLAPFIILPFTLEKLCFSVENAFHREFFILQFKIDFFETAPGALTSLLFILIGVTLIHLFRLLLIHFLKSRNKEILFLMIGCGIFFASGIMDSLIGSGVFDFFYTMENNLRHLATHDILTELPNRLLLQDRVNQALSQALRYNYYVSIQLIDFDHFKDINDTMGHQTGDQLLKEASLRIQRCLREYDTVARMSGDEFVVLLGDLKAEQESEFVARRILNVFREPFLINGKEIYFTPSIGISLYPTDEEINFFIFLQA